MECLVSQLLHCTPKLVSTFFFAIQICVVKDLLYRYPKPIPSGVFVPGWAYLDVQVSIF